MSILKDNKCPKNCELPKTYMKLDKIASKKGISNVKCAVRQFLHVVSDLPRSTVFALSWPLPSLTRKPYLCTNKYNPIVEHSFLTSTNNAIMSSYSFSQLSRRLTLGAHLMAPVNQVVSSMSWLPGLRSGLDQEHDIPKFWRVNNFWGAWPLRSFIFWTPVPHNPSMMVTLKLNLRPIQVVSKFERLLTEDRKGHFVHSNSYTSQKKEKKKMKMLKSSTVIVPFSAGTATLIHIWSSIPVSVSYCHCETRTSDW